MSVFYRILAAMIILLGIEQYGEHRVQVEWDKEHSINSAIAKKEDDRDKLANEVADKQRKKDIENAKSEAARTAIANWLRDHGVLPNGTSMPGSDSDQTNCTCKPDGSTGKLGTGKQITDFAEGCALDALHVLSWQEWAIREGLDVNR